MMDKAESGCATMPIKVPWPESGALSDDIRYMGTPGN
jgi:hypothetical protein